MMKKMQNQMDNLELKVAKECKEGKEWMGKYVNWSIDDND